MVFALIFSKFYASCFCIELLLLGESLKIISGIVLERCEEFFTHVKSQERRRDFLWRGGRILHFLVLSVKTLVDTGAKL